MARLYVLDAVAGVAEETVGLSQITDGDGDVASGVFHYSPDDPAFAKYFTCGKPSKWASCVNMVASCKTAVA